MPSFIGAPCGGCGTVRRVTRTAAAPAIVARPTSQTVVTARDTTATAIAGFVATTPESASTQRDVASPGASR